MEELSGAVEERDRLQADLRALDAESAARPVDPGIVAGDPERPADIPRSPVRCQLPRTRMVSPKVVRLMHSRRLSLERPRPAAAARRNSTRVDSSPGNDPTAGIGLRSEEAVDEADMEAARYERSI